MTDLSTRYMGLELDNPLVASPSPLSRTVDGVRRLADAGVAAVVLHSLFEEQLQRAAAIDDALATAGTESFAEALSYFPSTVADGGGPLPHVRLLERTSSFGLPVIASLNGVSPSGWTGYARVLEDAGASAIELNIYPMSAGNGREVEQRHLDLLASVKQVVEVPVAVKISPHFSSIPGIAAQLDAAGADALVLFNRLPVTDIDVETLAVTHRVELSTPGEAGPVRDWIARLYGRVDASLAATTGVETPEDVVKYLLAGADVVMSATALLRHGPAYAAVLLDGIRGWMTRRGFSSLDEFRGLVVSGHGGGAVAERTDYFGALSQANATEFGPW